MKKRKKINILILIFLFGIWLFGLLFLGKNGFFVLVDREKNAIKTKSIALLKGDKVVGEFVSQKENLSGLEINFKDANRIEYDKQDELVFKIKEKDSNEWLLENKYKSGLIKDSLNLPIGFLPINNSENKIYYFEIVSQNGNKQNYVTTPDTKNINTLYQFPKERIIQNPSIFIDFLILKITNSLTNPDLLISSLVFAIPFLGYLLYLVFNGKAVLKIPLYVLGLAMILVDIVFVGSTNYGITAIAFIFVLSIFIKFKDYRGPAFLFVLFSVFWILMKIFGVSSYEEKINLWLCLILILNFILLYYFEFLNKKHNKKFTYRNIYNDESQKFRFKLYEFLNIEKIFKNMIVLDLGCGYGPDAINFSEYAKKIEGVDVDKHEEWEKINNKKIKFTVGYSEKIPFKDNYFDAVFLKDLLHHVEDVGETLKEIYRVTKKNGKIIILEGNRYNPIFYMYATKINGHEHFTQKEFNSLIKNNFKKVEIQAFNIYPPFFLRGIVYDLFLSLILKINKIQIFKRFFSYNIAIVTKI